MANLKAFLKEESKDQLIQEACSVLLPPGSGTICLGERKSKQECIGFGFYVEWFFGWVLKVFYDIMDGLMVF